ncbi:NAD-P-binding protein [Dendrothele bispora CBS 962.96]|uniref:NAD-P-binding protein n=1 Tax=Dendrothele bispora (strain CBS 962.96) TaxID=1314807 RepID=A0A4S8MIQ3_DENBC|nr:NAD-P-binding protein [Dendrothele bispora CBS 962.96]
MFSSKFDPKKDLVDLKGKVVIVTGGNRGIGYATVQHLARAGAKVYMATRSEDKAKEAIESLKKSRVDPGEVAYLKLDLNDPKQAKRAAEEFATKETRLDILVNNAAMISSPFELTEDISTMIMVNHIGPFVFTQSLLPILTSTAMEPNSDVRIVNVTSKAHQLTPGPIKFETIDDFKPEYKDKFLGGFLRYCHSKLLNIPWSRSLQHRFDKADPTPIPITVIAIHPGGVDTFSHRWPLPWLWKPIVGLAINSPEMGAYTSVFAAASKKVREEKERGKYRAAYLESHPPGHFAKPKKEALDEKVAEDLWRLTEEYLKRFES